MTKTALSVLSLTTAILAACAVALPSSAQVALDLGGAGALGISGIPGIDASPYPARSITPSTVGGGNASVIPGYAINGTPTSLGTNGVSMANGILTNAPGMATNQQAIALPTNRGYSLPPTSMNLMAPNSVDTSPFPSGHWTYGFPNEGSAPFRGVSGGSIGGFTPATSTSSVDINTYDGPLRDPGTASYASFANNNINFSIPVGGVRIGGSINPNAALNSVQSFFGQ